MSGRRQRVDVQADVIAEVAHEMRAPLAVVTGLADMLVLRWENLGDERKVEIAAAIERQGRRAAALVDDLLSAARLDGGCVSVELVAVDLHALLPSIVGDRAVEVSVAPNLRAIADPARVEQIVVILIENANRYGAPPVIISVERADSEVSIRVRDHGPGVASHDRDMLFERFSELSRGRAGSTGLGLYIARGLARAMAGDLVYEPTRCGACFVLRLPAAPLVLEDVADHAGTAGRGGLVHRLDAG